jgi:FdhD protein
MIVPGRGSVPVEVDRRRGDERRTVRDRVASEEPLEIRLEVPGGDGDGSEPQVHPVAVTMRTPGNDFELAAGFLFSEGIIGSRDDVRTISYCTGPETQEYNVVSVALREGAPFDPTLLNRNFYTTSSCGVCGKASLDAVEVKGCVAFPPVSGPTLVPQVLRGLPDALRAAQGVFRRTGGIHAAALVGSDGSFRVVREDVGRHNAVDRVVGHAFLAGAIPPPEGLLLVSGRASFEILQKALAAGVPAVAAVGAPSSLAVDLARRFGMTLIGFLSERGFNVYTGGERVAEEKEGGAPV